MSIFPFRGRAGRVQVPLRRRCRRFAPTNPEPLESRALLAAGSFGINVEINAYSSYVNWLQTKGDWNANPGNSNPIVLNASGDPESDANLLFDLRVNQSWNGPDPNAVPPPLAGTYSLTFNGQATIQPEYPGFSTPFTVQGQAYNAATNTTTASLVVPANNTADFFAIEFVNTQATSTSALDTGFSNARLIRPGYAANSTQLYSNQFLAALAPYSVLRYLDDDGANNQPFFDGNTLVTVDAPQVDQTGQPWEYLIALANETNTDMWINVPQGATDAYVTALAGIIKNGGTVDGVTYPGLNPNLKIYLEYSNEVWGGIPYNEYYQESAVQNIATNTPLSSFPGNLDIYNNTDGTTTTNVNTAVGRRYLERTYDISQLFQGVLGADPTHQRIRPVLGWQENSPSFYAPALDWFEHFFEPASAAFYGMGDANYFSPTTYSSVNAAIASLEAQESALSIPETSAYTALAISYGLKNVSYEGGPAISGNSTATDAVALATSRDPRMEQIVYQHYVDFYEAGGTLAMMYSGPFGTWTPSNEWQAAELAQVGDPTASAKYRGTVDVANAAPVAATAGIPVPATSPTSFSASSDSIGTNFLNPSTGQQAFWLLDAASAGSYDLQLKTSATGGVAPGQVDVYLDSVLIGGPISVSASSTIDLGNLPLAAGLNGLTIYAVHGENDSGSNNTAYYQFQPIQFTLTPAGYAAPPPPTPPTVSDPGFEALTVGSGSYLTDPAGDAWTFSGTSGNGSGISANGSAFTSGNPAAPQGTQVAFLQEDGAITQTVANWAAGSYAISLDAAQRGNNGTSVEDFEVLVDGNVVGTFKPTGTTYQFYTTTTFAVAAGAHAIEFLGLDSAGGNNTAFIDAVSVADATVTPPGDAGFEGLVAGSGNYLYDPSGDAWTFSGAPGNGSGISGNGSGLTAGNPAAPQGTQVGFVQEHGAIIQTVANWAAGSYAISLDAAQRGNNGTSVEDFEVLVDGNVVGTFKPTGTTYQFYTTTTFAVAAGAHTIEFLGLDSAGGDNTALLDAISLAVVNAGPTVGDAGFEQVRYASGAFGTPVTGTPWAFSGSAGVSSNGSAFTTGNPVAPQGTQVAYIQSHGCFSQTVANWAAGSYSISFDAAKRAIYSGFENFEVLVDGNVVGTFDPTSTSYLLYTTSTFTVTAGAHAIEFLGVDSAGGDNTAFVDNVSITIANPTVGDAGFEGVATGSGNYLYDPTGGPWAFSGSAGVSSNGSAFTTGNPAAPQGTQVAFLQSHGAFTQTVANWTAGSYNITFDAAQRAKYSGIEDFEVLVDGTVVGIFKPTSTSYQIYTTATFTVTAGAHTIEFLGLDSAGGDNTAFVDNVSIT